MSWTESEIAAFLDGTFTKIREGRTITEIVDNDFDPIVNKGGRPIGTRNVLPHAFWKPEDDAYLLRQRIIGVPFRDIAWNLDRTEESVKKRHKILVTKGVQP